MKKKILYIFLVGVIATIVSLFRYTPQYIIMCDPVSCPPVRASRGYPLPIPVSEYKYVDGGVLAQDADVKTINKEDLKVVTKKQPTEAELSDMLFAWKVLKHVKSNAILIAKNNTTVGIGPGQVSRVEAVEIAIRKSGDKIAGAVLASDAFFPFRDSIDKIAATGLKAIIQPGGSVKDEEVIKACDEHGLAMVFTGFRCFKH